MDKKRYLAIKKWNDDYNDGAIYSLVDANGKRYIGQAKHLQNRLHTHRIELNRIYNGGTSCVEGKKLIDAVKGGAVFTVEILRKIKWYEMTINELRFWEGYYLEKYGGIDNTYNTIPAYYPNYNFEPDNEVELIIEIDSEEYNYLNNKCNNINEYIKNLIREKIKKDRP